MLTGKEIIKDGHPTLRKRAEIVPMPPSDDDKETLRQMLEFLHNCQKSEFVEKYNVRTGIGLAAPQLDISKRMIAVYIVVKDEATNHALFNPRIVSHSNELIYLSGGEGCLSVDGAHPGFVPRFSKVKVKANTIDGEEIQLSFTGLAAICFQHEIDHLNGVMFYDHIDKKDPFKVIEGALPYTRELTDK